FELHYYYDASVAESEGQLYNDDGLTADAYEKGRYELMNFESEVSKKKIEMEFARLSDGQEAEIGNTFQAQTKFIDLVLHHINDQPKQIKINGKRVAVT